MAVHRVYIPTRCSRWFTEIGIGLLGSRHLGDASTLPSLSGCTSSVHFVRGSTSSVQNRDARPAQLTFVCCSPGAGFCVPMPARIPSTLHLSNLEKYIGCTLAVHRVYKLPCSRCLRHRSQLCPQLRLCRCSTQPEV
ncbi:hypothetical protein D3C73_1250010 [compost metagenome]